MTTRGTRLENSGWTPDEQARSFAIMHDLDPDCIWAQFSDYWISKPGANATKMDWKRTWQTWCRTEGEKVKRRKSYGHRNDTPSDLSTGRPRKCIDNRFYDFVDALQIRERSQGPWPISEHEQKVLDAWWPK